MADKKSLWFLLVGVIVILVVLVEIESLYSPKSATTQNITNSSGTSSISINGTAASIEGSMDVPAGYTIYDFALEPEQHRLYAVGSNMYLAGISTIFVFNTSSDKLIKNMSLPFQGSLVPRSRIIVNNETGMIYVLLANFTEATDINGVQYTQPNDVIYLINSTTYNVSRTIYTGIYYDIAGIAASNNLIYAEIEQSNNASKFFPAHIVAYYDQNGSVAWNSDNFSLPSAYYSNYSENYIPVSLGFGLNQKTDTLYALCWSVDTYAVFAINGSTGKIINSTKLSIQTTNANQELLVDPENNRVYVFNPGSLAGGGVYNQGITEVDGLTGAVLANFTLPQGQVLSTTTAINPNENKIYVGYVSGASGVFTLNATTGATLTNTQLSSPATGLYISTALMRYSAAESALYTYPGQVGVAEGSIVKIKVP